MHDGPRTGHGAAVRDERVPLALGRSLVGLGRYDEALEWLATAAALDGGGDEVELWFYRGAAHEGLGDRSRALSSYQQALSIDPEHRPSLDALDRAARHTTG